MKSFAKALLAFGVVALLSVMTVSCEQGDSPKNDDDDGVANATVPAGYEVVYMDTAAFTGSAVRLHMHTNNRIAATLSIAEIFGAAAKEYKVDRTLIQTFEADEAAGADYYWDRTISGNAALATVEGTLTFTITDAADAYVYSGNIGAAGLSSAYIGMVVKSDEWAALAAATGAAADAIRFEFHGESGVVSAAAGITTQFLP